MITALGASTIKKLHGANDIFMTHRFFLRFIVLFPLVFLFISKLSVAQQLPIYSEQRALFKKAEKQVWQENSASYKQLYNQLHYYPLQPYLDQRRLLHKIRLKDAPEIAEFLIKYQGTPLDWPLRKAWLKYLAKRKRKALFLEFFQTK